MSIEERNVHDDFIVNLALRRARQLVIHAAIALSFDDTMEAVVSRATLNKWCLELSSIIHNETDSGEDELVTSDSSLLAKEKIRSVYGDFFDNWSGRFEDMFDYDFTDYDYEKANAIRRCRTEFLTEDSVTLIPFRDIINAIRGKIHFEYGVLPELAQVKELILMLLYKASLIETFKGATFNSSSWILSHADLKKLFDSVPIDKQRLKGIQNLLLEVIRNYDAIRYIKTAGFDFKGNTLVIEQTQ